MLDDEWFDALEDINEHKNTISAEENFQQNPCSQPQGQDGSYTENVCSMQSIPGRNIFDMGKQGCPKQISNLEPLPINLPSVSKKDQSHPVMRLNDLPKSTGFLASMQQLSNSDQKQESLAAEITEARPSETIDGLGEAKLPVPYTVLGGMIPRQQVTIAQKRGTKIQGDIVSRFKQQQPELHGQQLQEDSSSYGTNQQRQLRNPQQPLQSPTFQTGNNPQPSIGMFELWENDTMRVHHPETSEEKHIREYSYLHETNVSRRTILENTPGQLQDNNRELRAIRPSIDAKLSQFSGHNMGNARHPPMLQNDATEKSTNAQCHFQALPVMPIMQRFPVRFPVQGTFGNHRQTQGVSGSPECLTPFQNQHRLPPGIGLIEAPAEYPGYTTLGGTSNSDFRQQQIGFIPRPHIQNTQEPWNISGMLPFSSPEYQSHIGQYEQHRMTTQDPNQQEIYQTGQLQQHNASKEFFRAAGQYNPQYVWPHQVQNQEQVYVPKPETLMQQSRVPSAQNLASYERVMRQEQLQQQWQQHMYQQNPHAQMYHDHSPRFTRAPNPYQQAPQPQGQNSTPRGFMSNEVPQNVDHQQSRWQNVPPTGPFTARQEGYNEGQTVQDHNQQNIPHDSELIRNQVQQNAEATYETWAQLANLVLMNAGAPPQDMEQLKQLFQDAMTRKCDDKEDSPDVKPKLTLAKRMKKQCTDDDGFIYKLKRRKLMEDEENRLAKYEIGKRRPDSGEGKVLLLVGATGSGKSTLIDGIVNYAYGVTWEDKFRLKLILEEGEKCQAYSQTKWISAYVLQKQHESALPYTLTVIDTPGFGDTEGIKADENLKNQIRKFFSNGGNIGVDQLDGICFVVQASQARLTPTQKYIFDSILSVFGRDVEDSIYVLTTFSDNNRPPVLETLNKAEIPYKTHFKEYKSSPPLQHVPDEIEPKTETEKEYSRSSPLSRPTSCLRSDLLFSPSRLSYSLGKLERLRQEHAALKMHETELEMNKSFMIKVNVHKLVKKDMDYGEYVTNCLRCSFSCHYPCMIPQDNVKDMCSAMGVDMETGVTTHCLVCPNHCPPDQHVNNTYRFEIYEVEETRTAEDLKEKYEAAAGKMLDAEEIVKELTKEFNRERAKILQLTKQAHACLKKLDEIALKPDPLGVTDYLDLLIETEKKENRPGYLQRIKYLENTRAKAALGEMLKKDFDPFEEYTKEFEEKGIDISMFDPDSGSDDNEDESSPESDEISN
ncbi:unnamed protein product [Darwinula stevensoni]|uniref:AIG1-type G domain-containing protein n=1 Tax=Darwinula stevensoni TaxID=69355 RepID=A0A7R8X232_9CRUS|nr:unnamed protein product [Darwinula stevensoni]CAG0882937.1 unnamed protein product [Darwinula stevensoni]